MVKYMHELYLHLVMVITSVIQCRKCEAYAWCALCKINEGSSLENLNAASIQTCMANRSVLGSESSA